MARSFDPILLEVIKNELASITEEMAIAVWKTGRSAHVVKTGDFATALCDGQGRLLGQGYAAPFQLAFFMADTLPAEKVWRHISARRRRGRQRPYAGVTHMPDVAIIAPAFWLDQLVAFTLAYSHHTDIGGRFPGGFSSQCTETFEEGLRLPMTKLYQAGERNDALLDTILANVRVSDE